MRHALTATALVALLPSLTSIAAAQQPSAAYVITSVRPLHDAARSLQEQYRKVVSYEETLLTWRGEVEGLPGGGKSERFTKPQSFAMPEIRPGTDLAAALDSTITAYHQATSGTRFQVLSSKLGYHIVPVQMLDENGQSVLTTSLLDQMITVPTEARTAMDHLKAFGAAINSVQATRLVIDVAFGFRPDSFDTAFRAQPQVFPWGLQSTTARDALIDLLNQSATTMSWQLLCQSNAQPSDRFCVLGVVLIQVPTTDSEGKPAKTPLLFDRGR